MKIGYPCINLTLGCTPSSTFRLKSFSETRFFEIVEKNLECLKKIILYNIGQKLYFLRITSDLVPFASHPINKINWQKIFKNHFKELGLIIKKNNIRISMHPDQFTLINAKEKRIVEASVRELLYHSSVLDLMELDESSKIQIHVGGVYGEKEKSIERFIKEYLSLSLKIKKRLVIENDHRSYSLKDCLMIHERTKIPILFDVYHHKILNNGESLKSALLKVTKTWKKSDGCLMIDYSSQKDGSNLGAHTEHINLIDFKNFLHKSKPFDFDIMLEIKDKEKSALLALKELQDDPRFFI